MIKQFRVGGSATGIEQLLNGNPDKINPELPLDEQTELLPYDKKWEFPSHRLRLGILYCSLVRHLFQLFDLYSFILIVNN